MQSKGITHLEATQTTYKRLSQFEDIEQLNEAIGAHRRTHKLNNTESAVLELISRYSCKYLGVSFLSKNKIAAEVSKSRRTVIRACNRLEALGIIRQYETKRVTGDRRQSSNVIVICPLKAAGQGGANEGTPTDTPNDTPELSRQEASTKTNYKPKAHTRDWDERSSAGKRALKTGIPKAIYEAIAPFFNAKELYEVYGILLRAKANINRTIRLEDSSEMYIDEFMNIMRKYKLGEVKNFRGLLYSAWERTTAEICRDVGSVGLFGEILEGASA